MRDNYNCVPVFFKQDIIENFNYYHEAVLRPLFHNFKSLNDSEYALGNAYHW